jgi:hypothetical protein
MSLNGRALAAPPYRAAQMVVSPVEPDNFYGRPYTGILCFTPGSDFKAAVYLGPNPVVSMEDDNAGISCFRTGGQLLLTEKDSLRLDHLNDNVCAVADGNPYLLPEGSVTLQYVPDVIRVLKKGTKVICLAEFRGWIYVEAKVSGKTARGFISPSCLDLE